MLYTDLQKWMHKNRWVEAAMWSYGKRTVFTAISPAGAVVDIHVEGKSVVAVKPTREE